MSTLNSKVTPLTNLPQHVLYEICSQFCLHCRGEFKPAKGVGTPHQHRRQRPPQKPNHTSWYSLDKNALLSLALSCKYLHSIAEGFLYHEFAPGYGDSDLSRYYTFDLRLNQFMRTVGKRRDLAKKVRMIFLHHKHAHELDIETTIASLKQDSSDLGIDIAAAWQRRGDETLATVDWHERNSLRDYRYMWSTAFTDQIFEDHHENLSRTTEELWGSLHSELTPMLMALLPRLEHAILPRYTTWYTDDPFKALGIQDFPYFRTLEIKTGSTVIVEKAPNLQELNLFHKFASPIEISPSFCESCQITTLRIMEARHTPENVREPLSFASKNLQSFVYETESDYGMRPHTFNAEDVVQILQDYRHTLETLHLDFRGTLDNEANAVLYAPDFTLREFEKLSHVFLNTGILFNIARSLEGSESSFSDESDSPPDNIKDAISRRLPPSIVSLHLAYDKADIEEVEQALRGLAEAKSDTGRFSHLRHVGLHYCGGTGRLSKVVHKSIRAARIEFVYEDWPTTFVMTHLR